MATLVTSGRAGLAASVASQDIFLGLGAGNSSWDVDGTPAEDIADTALIATIGYRKTAQVDFATADPAGSIVLPTGRYNISPTQTNHLYMRFSLDFADASTATIRQTGLFLGTTPNGGLPVGQMFFLPTEIADPGTLYLLEHVTAINRTPATRETFEFVLTF